MTVLVGKQVSVLANRSPRTIRGLESHGMVLLYAVGE
jgi:tRNA-binding EMAP/Myf-like protein